jgi:tetraacyldisaccharide 4'-kinase
MSALLTPLQLPYAVVLGVKNLAYERRWLRTCRLGWPVVSVGNLSVGGAGKTPVVLALAEMLRSEGMQVDILSRGYGRRSAIPVERVETVGDAARFGDEPLLLARTAGVPVYVGASRYAAGCLAEQEASAHSSVNGVHLLDDGFQHRKLARTFDIVVLHPSDGAGRLLPAGRLREPLRALRRADLLLLREDDTATEAALERAGILAPRMRLRRELTVPSLAGPAFAFCGIAHPEEFFRQLRSAGVTLSGTLAFRDHHRFTPRDLEALVARAKGSAALLTTEKDLVRLSAEARTRLSACAPLLSAGLRVRFADAEGLAALLQARLARHVPSEGKQSV